MSDSSENEFDMGEIPDTLELLRVHVPSKNGFIVNGKRLFVPSVEFWNTRTTFRMTWPVAPDFLPLEMQAPVLEWAVDENGIDYGMSSAGGAGNGTTYDAFVCTASPIPEGVRQIALQVQGGSVIIEIAD